MNKERKHKNKMIKFAEHIDAEVWCKGVGEDKSKYQIVTGYSPNWRDDWDYEVVLPLYEQAFVWWIEDRLQRYDGEKWVDGNDKVIVFSLPTDSYRPKPERLVIFANLYDDGSFGLARRDKAEVVAARCGVDAKTMRFVQEDN